MIGRQKLKTSSKDHKTMKTSRLTKLLLLLSALAALSLSGCVMKQTTRDSRGVIQEEKYIIKRPVKNFIKNVEVE